LSSFPADRSILEPLFERRASSGARVEDLPPKEDSENRISKFKRKDWNLSKSQVIAEKAPEPDVMVKGGGQGGRGAGREGGREGGRERRKEGTRASKICLSADTCSLTAQQ
jgi:hypothetical protein